MKPWLLLAGLLAALGLAWAVIVLVVLFGNGPGTFRERRRRKRRFEDRLRDVVQYGEGHLEAAGIKFIE